MPGGGGIAFGNGNGTRLGPGSGRCVSQSVEAGAMQIGAMAEWCASLGFNDAPFQTERFSSACVGRIILDALPDLMSRHAQKTRKCVIACVYAFPNGIFFNAAKLRLRHRPTSVNASVFGSLRIQRQHSFKFLPLHFSTIQLLCNFQSEDSAL